MNTKLSELWIYPVKSLAGIPCDSAFAAARGFTHDRRWMVCSVENEFISQRECAAMALIQPAIVGDSLVLTHKKFTGASLRIPLDPGEGAPLRVRVWGDWVDAADCGGEAAAWLREMLGRPCKLVRMTENSFRPMDSKYSEPGESVSFADGYPYLVISQSSLDALNQKLAQALPMNRFRPNLVLVGCPAFEEDRWTQLRVGNLSFRIVKPCSRCLITTTDQETGIRAVEPLKTLATFRKMNSEVYFGQNLIADSEGWLETGMEVHFGGEQVNYPFNGEAK